MTLPGFSIARLSRRRAGSRTSSLAGKITAATCAACNAGNAGRDRQCRRTVTEPGGPASPLPARWWLECARLLRSPWQILPNVVRGAGPSAALTRRAERSIGLRFVRRAGLRRAGQGRGASVDVQPGGDTSLDPSASPSLSAALPAARAWCHEPEIAGRLVNGRPSKSTAGSDASGSPKRVQGRCYHDRGFARPASDGERQDAGEAQASTLN